MLMLSCDLGYILGSCDLAVTPMAAGTYSDRPATGFLELFLGVFFDCLFFCMYGMLLQVQDCTLLENR